MRSLIATPSRSAIFAISNIQTTAVSYCSKQNQSNQRRQTATAASKPTVPWQVTTGRECIVYQTTVIADNTTETCIGLCDSTFKARYSNYLCSFKHNKHSNSTELSKYIWNLQKSEHLLQQNLAQNKAINSIFVHHKEM